MRQRHVRVLFIGVVVVSISMVSIILEFGMIQSSLLEEFISPKTDGNNNIGSSSLPFTVDPLFQQQYDLIDGADMEQRCDRYGFQYNRTLDAVHAIDHSISTSTTDANSMNTGRRLFFGSMVADEGYDLIRMHAAEAYGMYHVVALVESDKTHTNTYREKLRFTPGTPGYDLLQSGIFGPHTRVYVDLFEGNAFGASGMDREEIQRQEILQRWKEAGMQEWDVGIMADLDETWTRDALHVGKHCDIPGFRLGQDCRRPRLKAYTLVFESSPECVTDVRRWYHPDFMLGECIEYIGNSQGRPTPVRKYMGVHGERKPGWGARDDYSDDVIKNGSFPLANAADMRVGIKNYARSNFKSHIVSGYHFHNFFDSIVELRHKYTTYGHADHRARSVPLTMIHKNDLGLMVRCVHDLPNTGLNGGRKRVIGGLDSYDGPKPIFFTNTTYRQERHAALKRMIEEDERLHARKYKKYATA